MNGKTPVPNVWIIMVNYRTPALALDSLRSLAPQFDDLGAGRVVVTDNASGDNSLKLLGEAIEQNGWQERVELMALPRNGGFAYGNNAGIRAALAATKRADYVMLLNPDTIVRPGAIRALVEFMESQPRTGIAGSLLENADGSVDCSAHRVFSPLGELDAGARLGVLSRLLHKHVVSPPLRSDNHSCDWVSGASLMVRREVLEQIGLMDEGFFLYFEETDFCWRAKRAGWEVWYVPASRIVHLEGAATGIRRVTRRAAYWYDSRRRFFIKHYGVGGLLLTDFLWAIGRTVYVLRGVLLPRRHGGRQDPQLFAYDILWGDLRAVMSGSAARISAEAGDK